MSYPSPCYDWKDKGQCKICLQKCSKKNGIKCQGACESWMHYKCLNYTPGKIKDIKLGLLVVTCPCPDCDTSAAKEFLTEEPFSCTNVKCPANNPPSCDKDECQANELSRNLPPRCPPPGTLRECTEKECRQHSQCIPQSETCGDLDDPCIKRYAIQPNPIEPEYVPVPKSCCKQPKQEGDMTQEVMHQMCKTVGELAEQLNFLIDNMKNR